MNPKAMKAVGIVGGIVVTILTAIVFYRSFQAGNPNYKMLIMSCGMAFFLFFLAFSKTRRK